MLAVYESSGIIQEEGCYVFGDASICVPSGFEDTSEGERLIFFEKEERKILFKNLKFKI